MLLKKIDRLKITLSGDVPDRTPIALWRHFPVDDQTPDGLASATIDFQRKYDFDFVKVTPASSFCLRDWGVDDEWRGATEGTRDYTVRAIETPKDWKRLQILDPYKGYLGQQLTALGLIVAELCKGVDPVPVIQTIFSPLAQAKNLVGKDNLIWHMRCHPEEVHEGLKRIVQVTEEFLEAARQIGIAGIFYAVQHANFTLLSSQEFMEFGRFYDMKILESVQDMWLNVLHLHGEQVMFSEVRDYPVQIINWHDRETFPSLAEARHIFHGTLCGGLQREKTMVLANPMTVTAEAHDAIQAAGPTRFILGTGCVLPTIAPHINIKAARQAVNAA